MTKVTICLAFLLFHNTMFSMLVESPPALKDIEVIYYLDDQAERGFRIITHEDDWKIFLDHHGVLQGYDIKNKKYLSVTKDLLREIEMLFRKMHGL